MSDPQRTFRDVTLAVCPSPIPDVLDDPIWWLIAATVVKQYSSVDSISNDT
jgi:hypothetical protein